MNVLAVDAAGQVQLVPANHSWVRMDEQSMMVVTFTSQPPAEYGRAVAVHLFRAEQNGQPYFKAYNFEVLYREYNGDRIFAV